MTSWVNVLLATVALPAAVLAAAPAGAASPRAQRLEVGFVSAAGVSVVVELASVPRGTDAVRSGSWVFSAGGDAVVVSTTDATSAAGLQEDRPSPPSGVNVRFASDDGLLITLTGLGDWQKDVELEPLGGKAHPTSPGVATTSDARLQVAPGELDSLVSGARFVAPAVLYGTRGAVSGLAWVDRRGAASGRVVALDDGELVDVPTRGEGVFIADVAQTCHRATPRAISARMVDHASVRLVATGEGGCLLSGAAVIPLSGAWLDKRREKPARALAIVVGSGAP